MSLNVLLCFTSKTITRKQENKKTYKVSVFFEVPKLFRIFWLFWLFRVEVTFWRWGDFFEVEVTNQHTPQHSTTLNNTPNTPQHHGSTRIHIFLHSSSLVTYFTTTNGCWLLDFKFGNSNWLENIGVCPFPTVERMINWKKKYHEIKRSYATFCDGF